MCFIIRTVDTTTDGFEKNSNTALRFIPRRSTYEKVRLAPRDLRRLVFELFSKPSGLWLSLGYTVGVINDKNWVLRFDKIKRAVAQIKMFHITQKSIDIY